MGNEVNTVYIDDKIDSALSRYLHTLKIDQAVLVHKDIDFKTVKNYEALLGADAVKTADIIIIDSQLFEDRNVVRKFTGEEFKMICTTVYPYSKVVVLSQHDELGKYGTIKKYTSATYKNHPNKFYDDSLKKILEEYAEEIIQKREILKTLNENINNYKPSLIVDKINEMMEGTATYKDLTDDKINDLIGLIEDELKPLISGEDSNGI